MEVYYAVAVGRIPGVYHTWAEAHEQVSGFPCGNVKKFSSLESAKRHVSGSFAEKETSPGKNQLTLLEKQSIQIFTDGSKSSSSPKCGYGIFFFHKENNLSQGIYGPVPDFPNCSHNTAEVFAIYRALVLAQNSQELQGKPIVIYSDSNYAVASINDYIHSWRKNEKYRRRPNYLLIDESEKILCKLNAKIYWIRGHDANQYNEIADELAKQGRISDNENSLRIEI